MRPGPNPLTLTLLLVGAVAAASQTGPADTDFHAVMSSAFEQAVGFDPFDERQLELVRRQEGEVRALPGFSETVAAGRRALADPTDRALERELVVRLGRLVQASGSQDVTTLVYFVFREAVLEQQEDKEYWLSKLKERNALAESLGKVLHDLDEATGALTRGRDSDHELRHELAASQAGPASAQARTGGQVPQTPLELVPGRLSRVIEGEALAPTSVASAGPVEVQPMQGFGGQWSGDAQLFWRPPAPVNEPIRNWPNLRLRFEVGVKQTYELTLVHTVAPDYGKFRLFLDGQIVTDVDGWAPQVDVRERALGEKVLAAGSHEMILTVFDRNPVSQGWYVGVDALRLTTAGQSSPGELKPRPQLEEPPGGPKSRPQLRQAPGASGTADRTAPMPDQQLFAAAVEVFTAPTTLPDSLTHEDRIALNGIVGELRVGNAEGGARAWEGLLRSMRSRPEPMVDARVLVQWVLRESYLDQVADLGLQADRAYFFNQQKQLIRQHLEEVRGARTSLRPDGTIELQTLVIRPGYESGKQSAHRGPFQVMSEHELAVYVEGLEERLQQVGDDAQLANIELQDLMQKQQQTLQTISNVSKLLHDTVTAVIRNFR